jgi:CBS domain-containing protein
MAPVEGTDVTTMTERDETLDFLRQHAPYDRMKREDLEFLADRLKPIRFRPGEAVTDPEAGPAEWYYILREGRVVGEDQGEDERLSGNAWELVPGEGFPIGALVANRPVRNVQRADEEVVCLTMDRAAFDALRERSAVFAEFCTHRLGGLLEKVNRQVRAEAVRDLGGDSSLNIALSEKTLRAPLTSEPGTPIAAVLERMSANKIGSMVVTDAEDRPIGIFTLKDLMNRVALKGVALETPIEAVMTRNPITVPRTAFAFEAAMVMANAGIQHVCVVEEERLVGVVSERDLFSLQRVGLVTLSKSISSAGTVEDLARLAGDIHLLVFQMIAQGVKVGQITQMITLLNDAITVRIIDLVLAETGVPDFPFTWIAFGSEGRQEQTLKTDQDNGILFAVPEGMDADAVRAILLPIADRVNVALDACGFPLCTGGIMARNPECCLSEAEWLARFVRWIDQGTPEHLLKASIFFDFRHIRGPEAPVRALREALSERIPRNSRFQRQMAANALSNAPPLGMIRDFRLSGTGADANTIDLKINGVALFIDAARILALANGIAATNTVERLNAVVAKGVLPAEEVAAWSDAYDYIRMLRMRINQDQAEEGKALSNRVAPDRLNDLDKRILRESFREARRLQARLAQAYQL